MKKAMLYTLCLVCTLSVLCACGEEIVPVEKQGMETASTVTSAPSTPVVSTPVSSLPESSAPESKPASKVSSTTSKAQTLAAWKKAYLNFLKTEEGSVRDGYALVYIDNDSIPELYLLGTCEAQGDMVCAYKNGKVIEQQLGRCYGGSYIPKSGLLCNQNGHMGYYYTMVYKLTGKGFTQVLSGSWEESEYIENPDGTGSFTYTYSIGEKTVTKKEYDAAINKVFNQNKAVSLYKNKVSYDKIVSQIKKHK